MRKLIFGLDGLVVQLTGPIILVEFKDMGHILQDLESVATQFDEPREARDVTSKIAPEMGLVLWQLGWRLQQHAETILDGDNASPLPN